MRAAHDVAAVRGAERALMATVPPGTLMQRAAAGLAAVCARELGRVYGARVVVLAGSGDNGGDALYAGARLARRGAAVLAVAAGPRIHEQGAAALRAAGGRVAAAEDPGLPGAIAQADLVLDGMLGIGGRGGLRGSFAALAGLVASARVDGAGAWGGSGAGEGDPGTGRVGGSPAVRGRPRRSAAASPVVVAVDLPSGIDADTGAVAGAALAADVTVTFGTCKPGLLIDPGASCAGRVELVDIGLGPHLPGPVAAVPGTADVAALLPPPPPESDKYRRGVVGIVAGSERFTGAAALAVGGAVRGGAGMVRLVSAPAAVAVVRQHWPEAVITVTGQGLPDGEEIGAAGRVQAWVVGPGMGVGEPARLRLAAALASDLPVLVDADGLTILAADPGLLDRSAPTLLTPHAGELARLLGTDPGQVAARRLEHVRAAADRFGATVLLKGSTTVVAAPGGEPVLVNPTGTSWLATAGTGDVLSGLAGALLAQGLLAPSAAAAAAFLHGLAARRAAAGLGVGEPAPQALGPSPAGGGAKPAEGPIGAADVIGALPGAIRQARRRWAWDRRRWA